jgi:hypothetical protein|tara:strand:- start:7853 stop:9130 length:1278 start_codon:yes stop_codon:yes gene_type:complete
MIKIVKALMVIFGSITLTACWDLARFQLDESDFDHPFSGTYFSVSDEFGPIGVYRKDGNWLVPEHHVDPVEKNRTQKKFEASQFAVVFIDKLAPSVSRFSLNSHVSSRQYSDRYSQDRNKKLVILVGQEYAGSGPKSQYIMPALINGDSISQCNGYGVFSMAPSGPGHDDYVKFVDVLFREDMVPAARTRAIFKAVIKNMMGAVQDDRMKCGEQAYKVSEISRAQVRVTVAGIVPAKAARKAGLAARQANMERDRLAKQEAEGAQTLLKELSGYYLVNKIGIARFESGGYRGGVKSYNLNVVEGHPAAPGGHMARTRFFADTQQLEYQSYAALRNGSCAEYTDPYWSASFKYSEWEAPGVWYEGSQDSPNRQRNGNACVAYEVAIGSCRRVRCSLRQRNQPYLGSVYIVQDYDKALALYGRLQNK